LYDFMQKFGIKCKKMYNWFRNFLMTCNARKALWMALYARKLKTTVVKICSWSTVKRLRSKTQWIEKYQKIEKKF